MESRDALVFQARLAQQCGRDDDMLSAMKVLLVASQDELTTTERNLLSVSLKNVLQRLRSSVSIARTLEIRERQLANDDGASLCRKYVKKLCVELFGFCEQTIEMVSGRARTVSAAASLDARVFWLKLMGDYWRYICEIENGIDLKDLGIERAHDARARAEDCYRAGIELASSLPITDATRLGLYLNETVFLYEIIGNRRAAIEITKACLDQTVEASPRLDDDGVDETEAIIELLANNLALWGQDAEDPPASLSTSVDAKDVRVLHAETLDLAKLHLR
ncbi:hypothetical protein OT_ostta08g00755 [Ostreococcus tauri]|uniref:14-3-3 domain-containing protein n=1 Tax=Ostreococcus tauri TaxID=70448 RepID=A0A090MEH9_OSTTA|nr:hypothetical protein OT_ostta08g00755 [Ostreococcus tauri]CEG01367.1 hypothetical protein OT_ostta08g00755 [Ostreococcus tauri]|eukprot:XP_003080643.2 hypothetical protein OT_ostta08g00755 [Ostreococcus tauri]